MDWRTANEQQEAALLRTFYMLIAMVLLLVRTELDARGAQLSSPVGGPPLGGAFPLTFRPASPPPRLYPAALRLLRAAEEAARRLTAMLREPFELMNQVSAMTLSTRERGFEPAGLTEPKPQRLDSS